MNIVLTGMRGSGKSYYGRALAKALSWKFLDTDEMIEKQQNATITEIVQNYGWPHFRKLEKTLCHDICENLNLDEYVIATGGGIIIDRENEALLRQNGKIILLYRDIDKCAEYIINGHKKDKRPPLKEPSSNSNHDSIEELRQELTETWNEREKRYRQSADLIVDVSKEKDPSEILEMLENI